ncbi:MAG: ABC transporter permease subunit [Bacteroidota bacterium]|nr:ABC transporter permease subunit [Bacteroidota bacterium]MDP4246390.1 ABC transporter permease subunit [Bacteroidota bacterium]MDP4259248.1 ABC transporter permease subunit [Bacteroidota bacterium]
MSRKFKAALFKILMILSTLIISGSLILILWTIASRGVHALTWELVSRLPEGGFYIGKGGGLLNAILGSLYITVGSTLLGLLIAVPVVLYLNVYSREGSRLATVVRFTFDVLFGIPSIVYGAFGFTIMVWLGLRASLLAGIVTVTLVIIPILARAMDEVMRRTPGELSDQTYSLGATRWETSLVFLRQCAPGIMTAILLASGRAIGDAASVLFTAGYTDNLPGSLTQPAATLPLAIFFQLSSPIAEVQDRAYGAALILTAIVLLFSLSAHYFSKRLSKNKI